MSEKLVSEQEFFKCPFCSDEIPLDEAELHEEVCIGAKEVKEAIVKDMTNHE